MILTDDRHTDDRRQTDGRATANTERELHVRQKLVPVPKPGVDCRRFDKVHE